MIKSINKLVISIVVGPVALPFILIVGFIYLLKGKGIERWMKYN
jgi:hypothetical protein